MLGLVAASLSQSNTWSNQSPYQSVTHIVGLSEKKERHADRQKKEKRERKKGRKKERKQAI